MRRKLSSAILIAGLLASNAQMYATDLTLKLSGPGPVTHKVVQYQCDGQGATLGLPSGPFAVEYVNGAGNSLAIVPVHGTSLIFANVMSGSGARYAAGNYIWWDAAGRTTTFSAEPLNSGNQNSGNQTANCHLTGEHQGSSR